MKYLKKFFESQIPQHIEDNLLGITDVLGEPKVIVRNYRNLRNYTLEWKFKMFSSNILDIESFFNQTKAQTKALLKFEDELLSARNRLKNFDITMNLNQKAEKLQVYLTERGEAHISGGSVEKTRTGGFIKHLDVENLEIILNKNWLHEYFERVIDFPAIRSIEINKKEEVHLNPEGIEEHEEKDIILIIAGDEWPGDVYDEQKDELYNPLDELKDAIKEELKYLDNKGTSHVEVELSADEMEMYFFQYDRGQDFVAEYDIKWA